MILTGILIGILAGYVILIAAFTVGWMRLRTYKRDTISPGVKVSVLVALRNEAANISSLMSSLCRQDYAADLFEIILVDDHSTDHSARLIEDFIAQQKGILKIRLISLEEGSAKGKKAALSRGISDSGGELILITDADCTAGKHWVSEMASFYGLYRPEMILGPVCMTHDGSFFGELQTIEFASLISSAAGSCQAGFPLLANGANIAFTRQAYESCRGFSGNMQYPSGDDMFMMMSIKKKYGAGSVRFIRSQEAIVNTPATRGLNSFIQQRMRWVSKSRGYTDPLLITTSIVVFLINAMLVAAASASVFYPGYRDFFFFLYFIKMLIDLPLMLSYSRFQRTASLLWLFPFMEIVNALYTLLIGIAGNIGKYEWKGRRI